MRKDLNSRLIAYFDRFVCTNLFSRLVSCNPSDWIRIEINELAWFLLFMFHDL